MTNQNQNQSFTSRLGLIIPNPVESTSRRAKSEKVDKVVTQEDVHVKVRSFTKACLAQLVDFYGSKNDQVMRNALHRKLVCLQIKHYSVIQMNQKAKKEWFFVDDVENRIQITYLAIAEYKEYAEKTKSELDMNCANDLATAFTDIFKADVTDEGLTEILETGEFDKHHDKFDDAYVEFTKIPAPEEVESEDVPEEEAELVEA